MGGIQNKNLGDLGVFRLHGLRRDMWREEVQKTVLKQSRRKAAPTK